MAQGIGARPCRGGAGGGARADGRRIILSLGEAARGVLLTADPAAKVRTARQAARDWRRGRLDWAFGDPPPLRPPRPPQPVLLPPGRMPKRGRAGSVASRIALLHALAHIEYVAIDLAVDMVARFGAAFPRAFSDDWMRVAGDEAMHFAILDRRLRTLGSVYGALPAHDGLWDSASATAHDAAARLAIVPMVLEARGLDVTPPTIARFEAAGDEASARLLRRILADEVRHVAVGVRWFRAICETRNESPTATWRRLVATCFSGSLRPPFNDSARTSAGLTCDFYAAVAQGDDADAQKFPSSREGQIPVTH